jgi:hypothetical protein
MYSGSYEEVVRDIPQLVNEYLVVVTNKNADRILSNVKMLEINISDAVKVMGK